MVASPARTGQRVPGRQLSRLTLRPATAPYTPPSVADLPIDLGTGLDEQLARVLDVEGKILRAVETLGPVGGRDVVVVDGSAGSALDSSPLSAPASPSSTATDDARYAVPDASADVVVAFWSAFRDASTDEVARAARVLRPGGRLLVGPRLRPRRRRRAPRDAARARAVEPPRRTVPADGFKIRVVHCCWTFDIDRRDADVPRGGVR